MRAMKTGLSLVTVIVLIALITIEFGNASNVNCENLSALNRSSPIDWSIQGDAPFNMSKFNESANACSRAIELNRFFVDAWDHKGNALRKMGNYNEDIAAYNIAIKLEPTRVDSWYNEGVALFDRGSYNESIRAFDRAIDLNPNSHCLGMEKANLSISQGCIRTPLRLMTRLWS
jgi:tetratricopeptide (TPR) repeat protein